MRLKRSSHIGVSPIGAAIVATLVFLTTPATLFAGFQEQIWGARPAGLGGTFTAIADDANAPAYNPAGISFLTHHEMTFMYAQLFSGLDLKVGQTEKSQLGLNYFSFAPRILEQKYGSFAFSWSNFNATNLLREDTMSLTYANRTVISSFENQPILAYGANIKFLRRSYSTDERTANDAVFQSGREASAVTGDLGVMFRPKFSVMPGLKFGAAAQNITQPDMGLAGSDRVPSKYTLGVAYQDLNFRLLNPAMDVSRRDGRTLVSLACESWMLRDTFAMRVGGNSDQIGGGFGYQFHLFDGVFMRLDYSLLWPLDIGDTNGSHRFSVTADF